MGVMGRKGGKGSKGCRGAGSKVNRFADPSPPPKQRKSARARALNQFYDDDGARALVETFPMPTN